VFLKYVETSAQFKKKVVDTNKFSITCKYKFLSALLKNKGCSINKRQCLWNVCFPLIAVIVLVFLVYFLCLFIFRCFPICVNNLPMQTNYSRALSPNTSFIEFLYFQITVPWPNTPGPSTQQLEISLYSRAQWNYQTSQS
jgi:hypothetical protein